MKNKIISKTIIIETVSLPPEADYIEAQIKAQKIEPVRWAIVDVEDKKLILSVSGYEV